MKTLRLSFASMLARAACALPCAAQGFTLGQVPSSPFRANTFAAGVDIRGGHDRSRRLSGATRTDYSSRGAQRVTFEASPAGSVEKWRSPVLPAHGDDARGVALSQTTGLVRRLREQNVEFGRVVFPEEVRDFLLLRHWPRACAAAADFSDRELKGQQR